MSADVYHATSYDLGVLIHKLRETLTDLGL